jgi:LPPG:FO 2-phospho-L-lactate transferase
VLNIAPRHRYLVAMITALAGGVGAARFLAGLTQVVAATEVTAIVNTADDETFLGLHVSPDIDSIIYTLAGASDVEQGWGLAGESYRTIEAASRFGEPTWFRLGDLDIATHLFRTRRLREGASLSEVTAEIVRAWNLELRLLPMSDHPVRTRITVDNAKRDELAMQEWFVRERSQPPVAAVHFAGADESRPATGVLDAIANAETIIVCPSNPVISIGPIISVPGILQALTDRRDSVVAVCPIVGGAPVKGPADRLMAPLGIEVSPVGVARHYAAWCSTLVLDVVDAHHAPAVEALGVRAVVTDTMMRTPDIAAALAAAVLKAAA